VLAQAKYPFEDPTLPWNTRTEDLVSRLSLEQIANFTLAVYGKTPASATNINVRPYRFLNECLRGLKGENATAWPQSLGLSATFR
jgi:beta-glucosidase